LQRFCNEIHVCNLLRHKGVDVVPLVGVYSTEEHPLGLVYEYMDNLDIKQYLQDKHSTERLKLVPIPCAPLYINALTFFDNS
jgi:serine/threonine protein kinase